MIRSLFLSFAALSVLITSIDVSAQGRSHLGREFYVVFGANTGGEQPDLETMNSVSLSIAAFATANVRIEIPSLEFDRTIVVSKDSGATIELPNGNNHSISAVLSRSDNAMILRKRAVHVSSDVDIAISARNSKRFSEDAFLILPVQSLGNEYRIVSYPASAGQGAEMPGQFALAAVEDDTRVEITTRCKTFDGKPQDVAYSVELDRGDAYLVLSGISNVEDLTGSLVTSSRPIAVFSGHERAAVPLDAKLFDGSAASRDHLYEQLPPVNTCGDTFFVVPFKATDRPDLVRAIATADNTKLFSNGEIVASLNAGEFFEWTELKTASMITSDKPILVAQYMGTSLGRLNDPNFPANGDPSLMLVPPTEQHLKEYQFHSYAYEIDSAWLTVVLPAIGYSSTRIDGVGLDLVDAIPGTDYVYSSRRIKSGKHLVTSSESIAVYVYGASGVSSFAMLAGMGVEPGGITKSSVEVSPASLNATLVPVASRGEVRLPVTQQAGEVRVFDRAGRSVGLKSEMCAGENRLVVQTLASGVYFYRASESGEQGSFLVP
ncbi:MAG TPA: IgGFc-binding protein [Candidatus Kapabacteria bacterium]|nr:IgGFc-binding protein [Candidatus Kapabacteria bacterium]